MTLTCKTCGKESEIELCDPYCMDCDPELKKKYVPHYSKTGELINEEPKDITDFLDEFYDTLWTNADEGNNKQYNKEWNLMWCEVIRYLSNYAHIDPNPLSALLNEFKKLQK